MEGMDERAEVVVVMVDGRLVVRTGTQLVLYAYILRNTVP